MKCRKRNSEITFMKVENTESFWKNLKETDVKVIKINENGVMMADSLSNVFAEFGDYLLVSDDGWAEVCREDEFNKRFEIIDTCKSNISDKTLEELLKLTKQYTDELIKIKNIVPNINLNFSDKMPALDINEILKTMKKSLDNCFKS